MKKGYKYLLHLFYWFLFFGWRGLASMLFPDDQPYTWADYVSPLSVGGYIAFMVPFYINYAFVMERYFRHNELENCWLSWFGLLVFFIFFRYFIEEFVFNLWFGTNNYSLGTSLVFYAFDNVYFGANNILMSIFIWAVANWKDLENERNTIAKERNVAELNLLKSQVNPHFLFNTLNNIYSLVYQRSEQALPAILRLSELMRFMTTESSADKIEISKEIEYIKGFIELESLRTMEKAAVDFAVIGAITNQKIAPLLLVPFVENGFKHGIVTDANNPFTIRINVNGNELELFTSNTIDRNRKTGTGTGLGNVRKRLDILYSGKYTLHIDEQGDLYICKLSIKL